VGAWIETKNNRRPPRGGVD